MWLTMQMSLFSNANTIAFFIFLGSRPRRTFASSSIIPLVSSLLATLDSLWEQQIAMRLPSLQPKMTETSDPVIPKETWSCLWALSSAGWVLRRRGIPPEAGNGIKDPEVWQSSGQRGAMIWDVTIGKESGCGALNLYELISLIWGSKVLNSLECTWATLQQN